MSKKTRNTLSGILVGVASVYAVINFAEVPAEEVSGFIVTTVLFMTGIVMLALLAVSVFKLLSLLKRKLLEKDAPWEGSLLDEHQRPDSGDEASGKDPEENEDRI